MPEATVDATQRTPRQPAVSGQFTGPPASTPTPGQLPGHQPDDLPVARPTIAPAAQAFCHEILLAGFSLLRSAPNASTLERIDREVLAAQYFYGDKGWLGNFEGFFA